MSPAAKTPGMLVSIVILSTTIWLRCSSNPQVLSGPRSATKPIATISSSAGIVRSSPVAVLEGDRRKPAVVAGMDRGDLAAGVAQVDGRLFELLDRRLVGAELRAVDQGDVRGDRLQRHRPVDRRVAAADDHDVLVAEVLDPLGEVVDALAFQLARCPGASSRFGSNAPTPAQTITVLL